MIPGLEPQDGAPNVTVFPFPEVDELLSLPLDSPEPPIDIEDFQELRDYPVIESPLCEQLGYEAEPLRAFHHDVPSLAHLQELEGPPDERARPAPCMAEGFEVFPSLPEFPGSAAASSGPCAGAEPRLVAQRMLPVAWGMDPGHPVQPKMPAFHDHCRNDDLASMTVRTRDCQSVISKHWRPRRQDWMMPRPGRPLVHTLAEAQDSASRPATVRTPCDRVRARVRAQSVTQRGAGLPSSPLAQRAGASRRSTRVRRGCPEVASKARTRRDARRSCRRRGSGARLPGPTPPRTPLLPCWSSVDLLRMSALSWARLVRSLATRRRARKRGAALDRAADPRPRAAADPQGRAARVRGQARRLARAPTRARDVARHANHRSRSSPRILILSILPQPSPHCWRLASDTNPIPALAVLAKLSYDNNNATCMRWSGGCARLISPLCGHHGRVRPVQENGHNSICFLSVTSLFAAVCNGWHRMPSARRSWPVVDVEYVMSVSQCACHALDMRPACDQGHRTYWAGRRCPAPLRHLAVRSCWRLGSLASLARKDDAHCKPWHSA